MQGDTPRNGFDAALKPDRPLVRETPWLAEIARTSRMRWTAVSPPVAAMLAVGLTAILLAPLAPKPAPIVQGLTAFFCGGLMISEFAVAVLLFVQFRGTRRPAHAVLGGAYLFSALATLPYLFTFPGALIQDAQVFGGDQSAAWVMSAWTLTFAAAALAAMVLESRPEGDPVPPARAEPLQRLAVLGASAGALVLCLLGAIAPDTHFALVSEAGWSGLYVLVNMATTAFLAGAIAFGLWRLPARSDLFVWLLVALAVLMAANVLAGIGGARFSYGWIFARLGAITSACVLLAYLLSVFAYRHQALGRARDMLEHRVTMRTAELSRMVSERDHLLREVYHRVKNNLQVVDSLLHLQAARLTSADGRAALVDTRRRIHTLGLVHQQLISSHARGPFNAAPFLADLCETLSTSFGAAERGVRLRARAEDVDLDLDHATPLGLIVSELVANALTHGFANRSSGLVDITLQRRGRVVALSVTDDGDSGDVSAFLAGPGLGGQIVRALAAQLDGEIEAMRDGARTAVALTFATPRPA
ncbi:MAG: sensor histidine kinase [Alphaproteobacteria bacterium]|nr:sensor histidine kinase [Alphaproteobacteria bacterium]